MKITKVLILLISILLTFIPSVYAQTFREKVGFVNDFEGIISNDVELENKLIELEKQTGVEIALVTTTDFQGTTIEDYAVRLFEKWGIGKKDKDNGLLILVSKKQRQARFEVGYGLEGTLPDALTGRIQDEFMIPMFKEGNFEKGINDGIDATIKIINNDPTVFSTQTVKNSSSVNEAVIYILFMIFYFLSFSKSWWMGGVVGLIFGLYISLKSPAFLDIFYLPPFFGVLGLVVDYLISRTFIGSAVRAISSHSSGSSGSGRSFSFGGGSSGGGGSSRSW